MLQLLEALCLRLMDAFTVDGAVSRHVGMGSEPGEHVVFAAKNDAFQFVSK